MGLERAACVVQVGFDASALRNGSSTAALRLVTQIAS